ncbi:MAG TPA: hypothetical protein VHE82_10130 [Gemmatimonadaceae bacterium]|nr:hypothetical protein [Gemmatimonadaceae bacterium]
MPINEESPRSASRVPAPLDDAAAVAQLRVSALTIVVVAAKPFDWLDLEPSLGFVLALVNLWIGIALLRVRRAAA